MESITKLAGHEFAGICALGGVRLSGTGVSGAAAARPAAVAPRAAANERPIMAPASAVVAVARTRAYDRITDVAGAGNQIFGQQKTQLHTMWALRGLDPWSDPA
ncbi:hypothetical protein [Streptomyces litchfieldiae]|uniref:Uncharacterized protein n=1 Tax=Streptomyces litchfieldiae TaxID=3075543 RepID=A0ABU2MLS0_9ACTN|nr:hypothetical protein [Streptomyces sp. DSM 44938]MDT0342562.1 hypothetical protein [Streptomyces sp. DSM 44938]